MDIHNYPIDYAVTVTDERVQDLLRERAVRAEARRGRDVPDVAPAAGHQRRWMLPVVWGESLILRGARWLFCWLVSART